MAPTKFQGSFMRDERKVGKALDPVKMENLSRDALTDEINNCGHLKNSSAL